LNSNPEQVGITAEKSETVDSVGQYEECKIVFVESDAAEETSEQEAFSVSEVADTYTSFFPFTMRLMAVVGMLAVCWAFFQFLSKKETFYTNIEDGEY